MSRSGYSDDCENVALWRGNVASAIRGRRGQAFIRDLITALDALPTKRLIAHELIEGNEVCALGSVGALRGVDLEVLDPEDHDTLSGAFDIARQLVMEVEYLNDEAEWWRRETPEKRWKRMRDWAVSQLRDTTP